MTKVYGTFDQAALNREYSARDTVPDIAPLRDASAAAPDDFRARMMSLLCIASLAGLPQVSLPLATVQGCPLGISLIAARGEDLLLLALARRIAG